MQNSIISTSHVETDRYKSILQAAESLFVERGYHKVSIEQIANAAGVSKGLVHYHFTNKEQLFVCILKDVLDKLSTSLDDIIKRDEPAKAKIRMVIKIYLNLASSRLELARITLFEAVLTEQAKSYLTTLMEENMLKMVGLVEDGISKGEFKPVDSRLVANMMTGAILEVMREASIRQRKLEADEITDGIVDILCSGVNR